MAKTDKKMQKKQTIAPRATMAWLRTQDKWEQRFLKNPGDFDEEMRYLYSRLATDDDSISLTFENVFDFFRKIVPGRSLTVHAPRLLAVRHPRFMYPWRQRIDSYLFAYVYSGNCRVDIGSAPLVLNRGDLMILPPESVFSLFADEEDIVLLLMIRHADLLRLFDGTAVERSGGYQALLNDGNLQIFHTADDHLIPGLILEIYREMFEVWDAFSDDIVMNRFQFFILTLLRLYDPPGKGADEDEKQQGLKEELLSVIRSQYATITLAQLAESMHYSVPYCSKYLKKTLGCNYAEALRRVRCEKAEEFLLETDEPVSWIAEQMGYENPESFIRAFKRNYGVTPGEFRLNGKNKKK